MVRIAYYYYLNPSFLLQPLGNRPSQRSTPLDGSKRWLKYEINQKKKKTFILLKKLLEDLFKKKKLKSNILKI